MLYKKSIDGQTQKSTAPHILSSFFIYKNGKKGQTPNIRRIKTIELYAVEAMLVQLKSQRARIVYTRAAKPTN